VCVFEEVLSSSHWRHLQLKSKAVDGIVNSALVVRAVTAVGNYGMPIYGSNS
jgi:Cu2+-containing amine oxidase